jgi:hypothetical protein
VLDPGDQGGVEERGGDEEVDQRVAGVAHGLPAALAAHPERRADRVVEPVLVGPLRDGGSRDGELQRSGGGAEGAGGPTMSTRSAPAGRPMRGPDGLCRRGRGRGLTGHGCLDRSRPGSPADRREDGSLLEG